MPALLVPILLRRFRPKSNLADLAAVKLLDGTRIYLQAVMDNFSRKVLAYHISEKYEPTAMATLLEEPASCLPPSIDDPTQTPPSISVYCDGGVENLNAALDQVLSRSQIQRVRAQIAGPNSPYA